jgi:hypothetical protein
MGTLLLLDLLKTNILIVRISDSNTYQYTEIMKNGSSISNLTQQILLLTEILVILTGLKFNAYGQKIEAINNGVAGKNNPCPLEADIWVLAGQSNMQGAGRTPDTLTDPKIWMMNLDNRWMVARCPLHRIFEATAPAYEIASYQLSGDPGKSMEKTRQFFREQAIISRQKPIGGVGPGIYFARQVLASTGRPIGLIPCALGGSTIDQWDPAGKIHGDSSLYGAMLNRVRSAGIQNIKGLIWSQGESEAMLGQPETY